MDKAAIEAAVRVAVHPLKPMDSNTQAPRDLLFGARRTEAGSSLPPYYLVYLLLVELLGFKNLGQFEKVAWSVPIDFNGRGFLIEHRKFGLGIFVQDIEHDLPAAAKIAALIRNAVSIAEPYFEWLADQAADGSDLNVVNRSAELYDRHKFYVERYKVKHAEVEARKHEKITTQYESGYSISSPTFELRREAKWLALAAIESFFSWTEHTFIHIAILKGDLLTGQDVKRAANENWHEKFDRALDRADPDTQAYYDELTVIRQQIRNFDAHGSFGKQREAFSFHSRVGAVPLRLPHQQGSGSMRFGQGIDFVEHEAIDLIERFIQHLWSGSRAPARIYIQESHLPLVLSHAKDGTYARAMVSEDGNVSLLRVSMRASGSLCQYGFLISASLS